MVIYCVKNKIKSNGPTMIEATCIVCHKKFMARASEVKRGKGKYCSRHCVGVWASINTKNLIHQSGSDNPNWKGGINNTERAHRHRDKYPERYMCRQITRNAIRRGALVRKPCEVCSRDKVEGHHDDYSLPLDIRWLCKKHHMALHLAYREN